MTLGKVMIDLNSDMGERSGPDPAGVDEELLAHVSSANVACGFHAGDPMVMDTTVRRAAAAGVAVGAHVSYPDRAGFGRRHLEESDEELITDVLYQIGALEGICRRHGTAVRYVKAHGALYNDLAGDARLAAAFGRAVAAYGQELAVLVLAGSPAVDVLGNVGVRVVQEGFADRAYTADGRLVSRRQAGAVLTDPATVGRRAVGIASGEPVEAVDGSPVVLDVQTLCVHGDTPGAVGLARAVRAALADRGIEVAPFA